MAQEPLKQGNEIKMEEPESAEEEMEAGLAMGRTREVAFRGSAQLEEPEEEPVQKWDAQLQEFLETLQPPCARDPQVPEARPGKDSRAAPEPPQGATPGGVQGAQAQPGEAKQDPAAPGCGQEKKRARTWDTVRAEMWRWRFRELRYQDEEGPRETCRQLQELCCQWLRPKRHSKEQILDLLALEQFLAVLPPGMQGCVRESDPQSCTQAVALAEEFLQAQQGAKGWEPQGSSGDMIVNLLETSKELPGAAKKPCFTEAKQGVDRSIHVSAGNGWLTKTEEELKPPLEGPKEEQPQEMMLETAKENNSPCGRKGNENPGRAESPNGKNYEMEATDPVFSEDPDHSLSEATALQQVNSVKCEAHKESLGQSPRFLTCEGSSAVEKTYKCGNCGRSFGSISDLVSHERTHVGEKLYKCAHCGGNERTLTGQKPHKCSRCGSAFGGNSQEGIHPEEKPYKCAVCGESFTSHFGLKVHQRTQMVKKPYKCSRCGKCFCWSSDLALHERIHATLFSDCGESLSPNSDLVEHEQTDTAQEAFACFARGKVFDVSAELAAPIQTRDEKPFECSVRGTTFQNFSQQTEHQDVHTREKQHTCLVCGENFRFLSHLKVHERIHKLHKCSYCPKSFRWSSHLVLHERIHTGEKPYRCSDCGRDFTWRSSLLVHVRRIHQGQKPYKCSDCGLSFSSNSGLLRHQKIHTRKELCTCSKCGETFCQRSDQIDRAGEKGSKCSKCLRSRDMSSDLVVRARNHAEERPFECSDCGKSFQYSWDLLKHQSVHGSVQPYLCSDCGRYLGKRPTGQKPYKCLDCKKS